MSTSAFLRYCALDVYSGLEYNGFNFTLYQGALTVFLEFQRK